jgi:ABC-type nitrate/sulfonate/bicarbonate transport system substrate-binding protein
MGSGSAIIAAVVGGSAEFGGASLFSVFNAYGHGIPIRIVAPAALYDTDNCDAWLVVSKDAPIHSARDLSGKIMGTDSPTDLYTVATRVWVDQNGGDGKSIRSIALGGNEQLIALQQGRIDFAVFKPPYLTVAVSSGRFRVLGKPLDVIAPRFLLSCCIGTADYLTRKAQTAKAFVDGLTESAHYVNHHPADTVDMVAEFTKQDPSQVRAGIREVIGERVSIANVQKPLDFAFKYGVIDRQYDARALLASVLPMSKTG